jgi:hypothetical protein
VPKAEGVAGGACAPPLPPAAPARLASLAAPLAPPATSAPSRARPPAAQSDDDSSSLSGSAAAKPPAPPAPREQAEAVAEAEAAPVAEGDRVFLLPAAWWEQWRAFSGYEPPELRHSPGRSPAAAAPAGGIGGGAAGDDGGGADDAAADGAAAAAGAGSQAPPPGPIDSRSLLEGGPVHITASGLSAQSLKPELEEGRDYVVVRAATWKLLGGWHGGGPAIERTAVLEGLGPDVKRPRIHLCPMRLEIWCWNCKESKWLEADAAVS